MEEHNETRNSIDEILHTAEQKKQQSTEKESRMKRAANQYMMLLAQAMAASKNPSAETTKSESEVSEIPHTTPCSSPKKRKKLERDYQLEFRVTGKELTALRERMDRCGCSQGEYLRSVALRGQIVVRPTPKLADVAALDAVRAELGRIGGLLKSTIRPNEGSANITQEEWQMVFASIRDIERLTAQIRRLLTETGKDCV